MGDGRTDRTATRKQRGLTTRAEIVLKWDSWWKILNPIFFYFYDPNQSNQHKKINFGGKHCLLNYICVVYCILLQTVCVGFTGMTSMNHTIVQCRLQNVHASEFTILQRIRGRFPAVITLHQSGLCTRLLNHYCTRCTELELSLIHI